MNKHVGRVLVDLETTSKIVYRVRACKSYNRLRLLNVNRMGVGGFEPLCLMVCNVSCDVCWRVRTSMFDGV